MNKKILILGGSGFIGKHIRSEIKKSQTWDVISIDKYEVDLCKPESIEKLRKLVTINQRDVVIILAAIKRQDKDGPDVKQINDAISQNISCALSEFTGQIIYFSSCAVYGEKNEQRYITEREELNPTSEYGHHKKYSEELYMRSKNEIANLLIVRPPLIYSCDEISGYSPGGFLHSAFKYSEISLWGDGSEVREFIHAADVGLVVVKFIENHSCGIINLVSGY